MLGHQGWHYGLVFLTMIFVLTFFAFNIQQNDISRSVRERDQCGEAAKKYALDAMDKYIDEKYKTEGIAVIASVNHDKVIEHLTDMVDQYNSVKSDIFDLTVSDVNLSLGSGTVQSTSGNIEHSRLVQSTYPEISFTLSGKMRKLIKSNGTTYMSFSMPITATLKNVSRDGNYNGTTKITEQPYNNKY